MMEVPTGNGGNDNGAGEAEGGRRRRRRATVPHGAATPAVSVEVLNRAAQSVLASIDSAMLVYQTQPRSAGKTRCQLPTANCQLPTLPRN